MAYWNLQFNVRLLIFYIPYKVNFLWFVSSEAERCSSKEIIYGAWNESITGNDLPKIY